MCPQGLDALICQEDLWIMQHSCMPDAMHRQQQLDGAAYGTANFFIPNTSLLAVGCENLLTAPIFSC